MGLDLAGRLDAVQFRHRDANQRDVRPKFARSPNRLATVGGLGNDLQPVLAFEQSTQPLPHQGAVLSQQNPYAHASPTYTAHTGVGAPAGAG